MARCTNPRCDGGYIYTRTPPMVERCPTCGGSGRDFDPVARAAADRADELPTDPNAPGGST
jgi:uncharacterized protein (DUF983 family)